MKKFQAILKRLSNVVFYCFVFSIPFTYFELGGEKGYVYNLPFFISLLGMAVSFSYFLLYERKRLFNPSIVSLLLVGLVLLLQSVLCSTKTIIALPVFGVQPIVTALKESVYILHAIFLFAYVYLAISGLKKVPFFVVFFVSLSIFLIITYFQLFLLAGMSVFGKVIDLLASFKISHPSSYFLEYKRICGTTPEAAHMTQIIFCYFIPVLAFYFINRKKSKRRFLVFLFIPLFVPIFYFARSTELVLTVLFVVFLVFGFYAFSRIKRGRYFEIAFLSLCLVGAIVVLIKTPFFYETVYNKIFGTFAYSTQKRLSPLYNSALTFIRNPLFGLGSGVSGYYYSDNIVDTWFMNSVEVRYYVARSAIPTASPFVFYFLCGYGLFGCYLFVKSLRPFIKENIENVARRNILVYITGLLSFLFLGVFVENIIANFYIAFLANSLLAIKTLFPNNSLATKVSPHSYTI